MISAPLPEAAIAAARNAAKQHLRIGNDAEDAMIDTMAATAIALGEAFTGIAWITREWRATIAADGAWHRLAVAPVRAVTDAGELAGDAYAVDIDARGEGRVRVTRGATQAEIRCEAGIAADWGTLPAPLRQGTVSLIAHLFAQRDGVVVVAPPAAVAALWRPWRRARLA